MSRILTITFTALLLATAQVANAVQVGFDDFDFTDAGADDGDQFTGDPNGNFLTRTFTPDNFNNLGFGATPGTFGGSNFDYFGISARTINFDIADDSADGSTPVAEIDNFGIVKLADTDNLVLASDTVNGNNPSGSGIINWTFDVSGFRNLSLSIDMAALGDFEASDQITFNAQIDGGSVQNLATITANEGVQYTMTNEFGNTFDRYTAPFFSGSDWDAWQMAGFPANFASPSGDVLNFHPLDNGTNGDLTAMDGLVPLTDGSQERGNQATNSNGTFTEIERELFKDPLSVDGTTDLNNDLTTFTFPISGTGSTLSIEVSITLNGDKEVFGMDDLLIEGDVDTGGPLADTDGDLDVDGTDFLDIQVNNPSLIPTFQTEYGTQPPAIGAVPEPNSLLLIGMSFCVAGLRRKAR